MKRTTFKTMAVLMALLACLSLQAVNTITHTATYDNSALTLGTDTLGGVTYSTVSYDGLYNGGLPGTPSLPIDYIRFSVPWNATNFTVSASPISGTIMPLGHQLYPNQPPRLMSDTSAVVITPPDSSAYQDNIFFPANRAWVVDEGFLAGENHIVTVAVMPMAYRHRLTSYMDQHQYRLSRNVTITLSYELSDTLAMYPIVRQSTTLRSEGYRLAQSMVVNPENVTTHAPTSVLPMDSLIVINPNGAGDGLNGHDWPSYPIDSTGLYLDSIPAVVGDEQMATYPYLIVTTPELKHAVRRIAALKNQKGLRTKVVTIDEVLNSPFSGQGDVVNHVLTYTDDAGKLRQYLRYCYTNLGTEYVLLAGSGVPYRYISIPKDTTINTDSENYDRNAPSDMYYSDLNYNWSDTTSYDLGAELYVGRLLSLSDGQINNYANKLLRYEMNPGYGNYSYLKKAFFSEGDDFNGLLYYMKRHLTNCFPNQIIVNDNKMGHPTGKEVIDTLNYDPVAFISIFNHGDTARVRVTGAIREYDSNYFIYSTSNPASGNGLNCLNNKNYPSIFYSPACTTVPYDCNNMAFGESFTTGLDYGGPVYIGYTRKVYNLRTSHIARYFAWSLKTGYHVMCQSNALSKIYAGSDYFRESILNAYLGDPSIEMWTDIPKEFSNINVTRRDNSIIISGIDMDSTIVSVSVCNVNNQVVTKIVTADSVTINDISPNSSIMLCKHNYIPYIAPMFLQNVTLNNSQYVIASDFNAGRSVESTRANGDVIVQRGVEYEIEASGTVTLQDGFKVEKGATFAIYPSSF